MYREIVASCYIFYGVVKLVLGSSLFITKLQTLPGFNLLKDEYADKTTAGRFYEYVLILFAVYTIIYGIGLFHVLPQSITNFLEYKHTENTLFIILGSILVLFYSLVLFTNVPIKKDMKYKKNYKLLGLFGGILFLITPFIIEGVFYLYPTFREQSIEVKSSWVLGTMLLLTVLAELFYKLYMRI